MIHKHGFTLAEVLITIGIIGVVAAITIPSLISAYQKHSTESRLKQAYSVLVNALRMSTADPDFNYTPPETYTAAALYTNDNYGIFKSYFVPYLQGVTTFSNRNTTWRGLTPAGNQSLANFGEECYCINNGMCFRMISHTESYYYILVDLNGPSRPNVIGKDIFYFALHFTDNGVTIDGKIYGISQASPTVALIQRCGKENPNWDGGNTCTELIIRNGWKIPKDYPIKF